MPKEKNSAPSSPAAISPGLLAHRVGGFDDRRAQQIELCAIGNERDHHLRHHRLAGLATGIDGGFEDGARLGFGDLGIAHGEPATAETQHGIELVQFGNARVELFDRHAELVGHGRRLFGFVWQKLVQGRIQKPDRHR